MYTFRRDVTRWVLTSYLPKMWELNEIKKKLNEKQSHEPPLLGHVQRVLLHNIDIMSNTMAVDQRGTDPCHAKMLNSTCQSSMDMANLTDSQPHIPYSSAYMHLTNCIEVLPNTTITG